MSLLFTRLLFVLPCLLLIWISTRGAKQNSWTLSSPSESCEVIVRLIDDGRLVYQVKRDGKVVLKDSPLGLTLRQGNFSSGLRFTQASEVSSQRERYELFAGIAPQVDTVLKRRSIEFKNSTGANMFIDLAASNQGVAFRYRFDTRSEEMREVLEERSGYHLAADARGWLQPYHAAGKYTPAYEDFYFRVAPGDPPPRSRDVPIGWSFPALFEVPSAASWVLVTEVSGEDPYPACHLAAGSADEIYRVAFPRQNELSTEKSPEIPEHAESRPLYQFPWTMPWRAIIVSPDAAGIATSTLVTDLAPPSKIADTSWIRPGRASWAWWSTPEGPFSEKTFNDSTDFSAKMGWEYTLFDAGWWDPGLGPIVRHAVSRKVKPLIWTHATDFIGQEKRRAKLNEIVADGAVGLKADFWCSDRQETIETIKALFQDAADRKLSVNLHGCTLPRGWHRTWPNFMSAEAVLGAESYLYESQYTEKAAELNTVLPFTRNVVGPMDYTPVAFSPKRYDRTTTAAHELATSIIFTSGIIHYADSPEALGSLPSEAVKILRDAPARWDETRCLVGEPGRIVVFARRSGSCWFIAGINGSQEPQEVSLDLREFGNQSQRVLISEGKDAKQKVAAEKLSVSKKWHHSIPPRGGFILRLDP